MSRSTYDVQEEYTGDGSLSAYTFDFKIEALKQLLVIELDDDGNETQRVRGTDTTYLSSVDYDAVDGGGTVNLAANLTNGYTLLILLANDEPTQPYQFKENGSFTLSLFEKALDYLGGAIQRLAFRANNALSIHETDSDDIDCVLPPGAADNAGQYIKVNDDGDGFEYGFTSDELVDLALPTATVNNQIPKWNGSAWIASLYGGGMVVSSTQNIASGGDITVNAGIQQLLKVQGDGGPQTASVSPFTGSFQNGMVITLLGMSDSNILMIPHTDAEYGCILNGNRYLNKGDTLTLVYDSSEKRFYEIARN